MMFIIKNKVTGMYFVGDTLMWTPYLEGAAIYLSAEDAATHLKQVLSNIKNNVCGIYLLETEQNQPLSYKLKFITMIKNDKHEWVVAPDSSF